MIKYDIRELTRLRSELGDQKDDVEKALRWAVNATSRKTATAISRDIRGTYALKARDIKERLKIQRYRRDATRALIYTGQSLPLSQFKPRTKRVTVSATSSRGKKFKTRRRATTVRVRKDVGRQTVGRMKKTTGSMDSGPGFLAKGHVLSRRNHSEHNINDQFSLISRYGPSIPGMVAHPETMEQAQDLVGRELPEQFNARLDYLLDKK